MRAVDTNTIVRLIARDDAQQTAAATAFLDQGVWISVVALTDALWVLSRQYQHKAADIMAAVEMLLNHENVTLQDSDAVAAALELFRSRPSLGFTDCLILELARKAGHLPLGTFDRALGKMEGAQKL